MISQYWQAFLRFMGILGPSAEMQEERARQSGAVLKYVDNERGGNSRKEKPKQKPTQPSRETLLKQLKDEAYSQGRNEELARLKQKLDFALQANAERVKAKVRQEVLEHSARIAELCCAAGCSRMAGTWVGQGMPLADVASNLQKEIRDSREIYEPERASRMTALTEAEVRFGLREHSWPELRVC